MKLFQIVSIIALIVSLTIFISTVYAQIQFYGADVDLGLDGNAKIKLTITFREPVNRFQLTIFGVIKNFNAVSNAGSVTCDITTGSASIIDCKMNLTHEKRSLELTFETVDFVKEVDSKNLFSLDLSLSRDIDQAFATVKLPEGYALTNTSLIQSVFPKTNTIISDGRRIIINWNMENLTSDKSFRFQALYEPTKGAFTGLFVLGIPGLVSIGTLSILTIGGGILLYRRIKKPREVILSVLDDSEKKTIEIITNAGGETTQKKVVQETNLSKAKVSRIINRLQERGLIEVTRLGRTNKLKLVKKKFEGV